MVKPGTVTPILRIFDETKTREFYLDFLGFSIDFEHRFEDGLPLYMGVSLSGCHLHLSEHHGDVCPGAHVRILNENVDQFCSDLAGKAYKYARPGEAEETPWGTKEVTLSDPFGNKLTFYQQI